MSITWKACSNRDQGFGVYGDTTAEPHLHSTCAVVGIARGKKWVINNSSIAGNTVNTFNNSSIV